MSRDVRDRTLRCWRMGECNGSRSGTGLRADLAQRVACAAKRETEGTTLGDLGPCTTAQAPRTRPLLIIGRRNVSRQPRSNSNLGSPLCALPAARGNAPATAHHTLRSLVDAVSGIEGRLRSSRAQSTSRKCRESLTWLISRWKHWPLPAKITHRTVVSCR